MKLLEVKESTGGKETTGEKKKLLGGKLVLGEKKLLEGRIYWGAIGVKSYLGEKETTGCRKNLWGKRNYWGEVTTGWKIETTCRQKNLQGMEECYLEERKYWV